MLYAGRFRLDRKVAVVTGAGRRLGRSMSLALVEAGASVVVPRELRLPDKEGRVRISQLAEERVEKAKEALRSQRPSQPGPENRQ